MSESTAAFEADESRIDVVYILLLLQGAMGLLSGAAMLIFMGGNPAALPLTIGAPLLLFVVAVGVGRGWRWSRKAALVMQGIVLLAFAVSFLLGLLAQLDVSFNLMTLVTNVAMPVAVIKLLRRAVPQVSPNVAAEVLRGARQVWELTTAGRGS
jgi:hypothetical protein